MALTSGGFSSDGVGLDAGVGPELGSVILCPPDCSMTLSQKLQKQEEAQP